MDPTVPSTLNTSSVTLAHTNLVLAGGSSPPTSANAVQLSTSQAYLTTQHPHPPHAPSPPDGGHFAMTGAKPAPIAVG